MTFARGKKVTVVGLKRAGAAAVKTLLDLGAEVKVTSLDRGADDEETKSLLSRVSSAEFGKHTPSYVEGQDLVVTSPGVKNDNPIITLARQLKIPVIDEIELAFGVCPGRVIAVTGTNGKSSVTNYIYSVLKDSRLGCHIGGNYGVPFSSFASAVKENEFVCLEVSSFQLQRIDRFRPFIAILLNVTVDHLDWHASFSEYVDAKFNIFKNQDSGDFALLNIKDEIIVQKAQDIKAHKIFFAEDDFNENVMAALCCCQILGISEERARGVIESLPALKYRVESVGGFCGKRFFNDSKATNIASCIFALKNIRKKVVLICGGRGKGQDFSVLRKEPTFGDFVEEVIVFGEAAPQIAAALEPVKKVHRVNGVEEAVKLSLSLSPEVILFSPMCSSFDMFDNYQHRAEEFNAVLGRMKESC